MNSKPQISKDIIEIEQLGNQHRAIRHMLESCERLIDSVTYNSLADLHDELIEQKKKLISKNYSSKITPTLRLIKN